MMTKPTDYNNFFFNEHLTLLGTCLLSKWKGLWFLFYTVMIFFLFMLLAWQTTPNFQVLLWLLDNYYPNSSVNDVNVVFHCIYSVKTKLIHSKDFHK